MKKKCKRENRNDTSICFLEYSIIFHLFKMEKCHVIYGQNLKFWLQCCWDTVVEKPQQCTVLSSCSSHLSGQLNWANTGESTVKPSLLSTQPHCALGLHSVLQVDFFFSVISAPLWFDKKNLEIWCEKNFINIKTTWQMKIEWDLLLRLR